VVDILLIAPADPGAPRALAAVAQALQNRCPSRHSTTLLHGTAADRPTVDKELPNHAVVLYLGHGQVGSLGASGLPLIDLANQQHVQHTLVAIACHAGAGLGPQHFGQSTTRAFLGFDTYLAHPAKAVGRANQVYEQTLGALLSGRILDDVATDMRRELPKAAQDYLTNRVSYGLARGEALGFFFGLRSNVIALRCVGATQTAI
jgi:hypothetical protein